MVKIINTIIVDDEPVARNRIKSLIQNEMDFKVIGEFGDSLEANKFLDIEAADLMFVDIKMPGLSGIDLVKSLRIDHMPLIVFVTAFDQFAVDAFELSALDYLLKPFSNARFQQTILRIRNHFDQEQSNINFKSRISHLLSIYNEEVEFDSEMTRISIKLGNKFYFIQLNDIVYIRSSGNYLQLYANDQFHLIRETMMNLLNKLPKSFIRIHKSSAINLDLIDSIISNGNGVYEVKLPNGEILTVSQTYKHELLKHL